MISRVCMRSGAGMPALGQGTWRMGEDASRRNAEIDALRLGLDLGMTLIDTAEMYAGGGAETMVAEAMRGRRDEVFLVSKVLPHNASRTGTVRAAENSLKRLGTDRIDLYLLHWSGSYPLEDTLEAFERLKGQGKIGHYGVSNFDLDELEGLARLDRAAGVEVNQVVYNLERRGIERNLVPWCNEKGTVVMAYSPLEQGRMDVRPEIEKVAARHGATPAQIALAWTIRGGDLVCIPKSSSLDHVRDNAAAAGLKLTERDLADLDSAYPVPSTDVPLGML